jgi:hypothetical protein
MKDVMLKNDSGAEKNACEYGKEYTVSLKMRNVNPQIPMNKIALKLRASNAASTDVRILDSVATANTNGDTTVIFNNVFRFKVSSDIQNNATLSFNLTAIVNDSVDRNQNFLLRYISAAPNIIITQKSIPIIKNSESARAFFLIKNVGIAAAENTIINVTSSNNYVHFDTSIFDIGTIIPQQEYGFYVPFRTGNDMPEFDIFDFVFNFSSNDRIQKNSVQSHISTAYETFESGDFSLIDWRQNLYAWKIDSVNFYEGRFSAASADIASNKTSTMYFIANVLVDDSIAFYYKTSSEKVSYGGTIYGDFLEFLIDGNIVNYWGGIEGWKRAAFAIKKGEHTFAWNYHKDISNTQGEDKVWVDNILLPIGTKIYFPATAESATLVDGAISGITQVGSADGSLHLRFAFSEKCSGQLWLLNLTGSSVELLDGALRLNGSVELRSYSVSGLPHGIYIVVMETKNGNIVSKVRL